MAFRSGKDAFLLLDNVAGTPVNVSGYHDNVSWPSPTDTIDVSVFGTASKQFVAGLNGGANISLSGPSDVGLGTFLAALHNAQAAGSTSTWTLTYGPGGSVAGQIKQSAETLLTDFSVNTAVGGRADYSATLQVTGVTTFTTW
jgi:hypothetical protein